MFIVHTVIAFCVAALVLKPEGQKLPMPTRLAERLAIAVGFSFALNSVMLKKYAQETESMGKQNKEWLAA